MTRVRRVLGSVAVAWLCCQVATVAFAPIAFWTGGSGGQLEVCTCAHGAVATCPMHHNTAAGSKRCVMRSANGSDMALMTSLLGVVGPIPESTAVIDRRPSGNLAIAAPGINSERPVPPDPPPPRA
jgi:hypothetical protein